jgi:hypothetical protein
MFVIKFFSSVFNLLSVYFVDLINQPSGVEHFSYPHLILIVSDDGEHLDYNWK